MHQAPGRGAFDLPASPALYFTYREHNETFESVALWFANDASVTGVGEPEEVPRLLATRELLPTLRVQPMLGRTFSESEDQSGSPGTVILSYGYWQRRFGGDENVLGRSMRVDGTPHEVIGVLPPDFRFLDQRMDIVTPMRPSEGMLFANSLGERGVARLEPGVTLADAARDIERMIPIMLDTFPFLPGSSREEFEQFGFGPNLRTLKESIVGDLKDVLWVLMGTIGMLLVIACANVANLQLVRTEARGHELAVRAALGAGWGAIARGLLLESLLLGLAGGAVGMALAAFGLPALLPLAADHLPAALDVGMDSTVLAFSLAVSVGSGVVFGLLPVVKHAGPQVVRMLSATGRSHSATRERHRARNALVAAEVALALVLLIASGLMIRSFQELRQVEPGFAAPERILTAHIFVSESAVPDFERAVRMLNDLQNRLVDIGGVESAGFSTRVPLATTGPNGPFTVEGRPDAPPLSIDFRYISPRWFETMGTPILAGRDLEWADYYDASRQFVVISEGLARREWGSAEAALGKRLRRSATSPWLEVVGVAGDIRHHGLEQPVPDTIYLSATERVAQFVIRSLTLFIRSERAGTAGFIEDVQRAVWSVRDDLPLGNVQTMGAVYKRSMARTSLTLILLAITGGMALALGLVGIYGVVSYMLSQRTREIGIRVALGARNGQLKRMLLAQLLVVVGVGVAFGLGGAGLLTRLMQSLLYGVKALDPATYVTVCAVLVVAAVLAGYLPARRVTRIDPMQALREE